MALIKILKNRVPLDNKYENPILFKNVKNGFTNTDLLTSLTPLEFLSKYDSSVNDISTYIRVNFRYGNTLNTRVVVNLSFLTPDEASSIYDCNYVIVRQEENAKLPYILFYFINNMSFEKGATTIVLDLELDIFTTFNKWSLNTSEVNTTRQHVDRFKNETSFNCEEALLPDLIDGQFNANIISKNENLRQNNYEYLMVYLSLNTPRNMLGYLRYDDTYNCVVDEGSYNSSKRNSNITFKSLNLPYMIGFLPLNELSSVKVTLQKLDGGKVSGTKDIYYDNTRFIYNHKTIMSLLVDNSYVLAMQVVSFNRPIVEHITEDDTLTKYVFVGLSHGETHQFGTPQGASYTNVVPLIVFEDLYKEKTDIGNIIPETQYSKTKDSIFENFYGLDISLNTPIKKDKRLEPKLYASPYAYFVLNGSSYKGMNLEPLGVGDTLYISENFIPTPLVNGNYYSIESGIYSNTKDNYLTISPYITSEIPNVNNKYNEFLATQKNSYAQGVTMSYFNNLLGTASGITSAIIGASTGNPIGIASGAIATAQSVTNLFTKPFEVASKMKDLKQTPSKLTSSNYDVYSVVGIADLNIKFNYITMLESEQNKVYEYFYRNGYQVERITEPRLTNNEVYINTRSYEKLPSLFNRRIFNYIKLNQDITNELVSPIGLSQAIRNKFNSILNRGCRFWNVTQDTKYLDFSYENYESNKEGH